MYGPGIDFASLSEDKNKAIQAGYKEKFVKKEENVKKDTDANVKIPMKIAHVMGRINREIETLGNVYAAKDTVSTMIFPFLYRLSF